MHIKPPPWTLKLPNSYILGPFLRRIAYVRIAFGVRKRALWSIRHTHDCLADVVSSLLL